MAKVHTKHITNPEQEALVPVFMDAVRSKIMDIRGQ